MTKMSLYLKCIKLHCSKHDEFNASCSACYKKLYAYYPYGSDGYNAIIRILNYASQLDSEASPPLTPQDLPPYTISIRC